MTIRRQYELGHGDPCLIAIGGDTTGRPRETSLACSAATRGAKAGVIETAFKEETETDLFGEQAIQSGKLARQWIDENRQGRRGFWQMRKDHAAHQLEQVGERLRAMMPWIAKNGLVDKAGN